MLPISINVTAPPYNAIGDGVADDTSAIQSAINASVLFPANKLIVEFPKATYIISSTLFLPSDVEINFNGATIKRHDGSNFIFDMLENANPSTGNSNITLKNVIIDGNRQIDSLSPVNNSDRFAGLKLENVTKSFLNNVTVINTVNGEIQPVGQKTTGGIFIYLSSDIICLGLNGYGNDRSAIFIYFSNRIRITGSVTYDNAGSGITSEKADECEYHDILTYNNGDPDLAPLENYTNLSINGIKCKATNITSYRATGSGVTLGHSNQYSACDYTFLSNVHTYNNKLDGVTVANSIGVSLIGIYADANTRNGIRLFNDVTHTRISHLVSNNSPGQGVLIEGGIGHVIDNAMIANNDYAGIYVESNAELTIGLGVEVINNSQNTPGVSAGVIINQANNCRIFGLSAYDDQGAPTQLNGVWIAGTGSPGLKNQIYFSEMIKGYQTPSIPIKQTSINNLQLDNQILYDRNEFNSYPILQNSWTTSSGAGYWLDRNGFVHLVGVFNGGTVATTVLTLPIGFWPETNLQFGTTANNLHANAVIDTAGNLILYSSNVNHYVDGILFKAKIV